MGRWNACDLPVFGLVKPFTENRLSTGIVPDADILTFESSLKDGSKVADSDSLDEIISVKPILIYLII